MPIAISCPDCGTTGNVPDTYAGQTVRCPKCRGKIRVEQGSTSGPASKLFSDDADQAAQPASATIEKTVEDQLRCPFCNELILTLAKKCKHCGEWLDGSQNREKPQSAGQLVPVTNLPTPSGAFDFDAPNQQPQGD